MSNSTRNRNRDYEAPEIKMFISQPEIDEVMKKDDQATAYIILQNSVLVQKTMDLIKEKDTIEQEKEELESYNDRLEKTRTCLQGYVRNEHDMVLKYKKLYEFERNMYVEYRNEFMITQIVPIIVFIIGLFGRTIYTLNIYFTSTVYIGFLSAYLVIIYSTNEYLYNKRHCKEIKEILEDIAKTTQSNTYIDDLIDNM